MSKSPDPRGRSRFGWLVPLGLLLFCCASMAAGSAGDDTAIRIRRVHVLQVEGAIGPITAEYISAELDPAAAAATADLIVIRLDTPGGLDTAMRRIVQAMLDSPIPIVVHVAPAGARAASAGVFLLAAADFGVMAPSTNTGAAHPVNMGGQLDETMAEKVTNDAVAYLQSIAADRERQGDWCEDMVRESRSVAASEALEIGMIDLIAADTEALLRGLDGRALAGRGPESSLRIGDVEIIDRPMDWRRKFLSTLVDPNIAYIFLMLGVYGLFFELSRPGAVLPGVVGVISLMLAVLAFQQLPVNYVGVILILLGMLMLLLEIKITSYGALGIGGALALLLGSMLLINDPGGVGRVSLKIILPLVAVTALGFVLIVGLGVRALGRPDATGNEALKGRTGRVVDIDAGTRDGMTRGRLAVDGELWAFRSRDIPGIGEDVRIEDVRRLELTVSRCRPPE